MNHTRRESKRSATLLANVHKVGVRRLPEALIRYSTKLGMIFRDGNCMKQRVYVEGPKPSRVLIDYLNSPDPQKRQDKDFMLDHLVRYNNTTKIPKPQKTSLNPLKSHKKNGISSNLRDTKLILLHAHKTS